MTDERVPDPKNDRDWMTEAFKIAEGIQPIQPRIEHIKALHKALMAQIMKGNAIRDAVSKIAKAAREGKLKPGMAIPGLPFQVGKIEQEKKDG